MEMRDEGPLPCVLCAQPAVDWGKFRGESKIVCQDCAKKFDTIRKTFEMSRDAYAITKMGEYWVAYGVN